MAPTDGTDVNIDSVAAFGKLALTKRVPDFVQGMSTAHGKAGQAMAGMSGTGEGLSFATVHAGMLEQLGQFMTDANIGVQALGSGAIVVAANYRTSDLSQKQALDSVTNAFNPPSGTESLSQDRSEAEAAARQDEFARQREQFFHPPAPHLPDAQPGQPQGEQPLTPQQEVTEHNDKFGEDETWRPPDPNAPPDDYYYGGDAGVVPGL